MIRRKGDTVRNTQSLYSHSNSNVVLSQSSFGHRTPSSSSIRHEESFSDFHEAYAEYESIGGDNTQGTTLNSQPERRTRKRDLLLCHSLLIITSVITAIMNAAITIFGMGVGVGLILGDTIRGSSLSARVGAVSNSTSAATNGQPSEHETVLVVQPATPNCRATIRRVPTRPPPPPHFSRTASTMPAQ